MSYSWQKKLTWSVLHGEITCGWGAVILLWVFFLLCITVSFQQITWGILFVSFIDQQLQIRREGSFQAFVPLQMSLVCSASGRGLALSKSAEVCFRNKTADSPRLLPETFLALVKEPLVYGLFFSSARLFLAYSGMSCVSSQGQVMHLAHLLPSIST